MNRKARPGKTKGAGPPADAGAGSRKTSVVSRIFDPAAAPPPFGTVARRRFLLAAISLPVFVFLAAVAGYAVQSSSLPKLWLEALASSRGLPPPDPRETMERIAFVLFVLTWFPFCLALPGISRDHGRLLSFLPAGRAVTFGVLAVPWLFLLMLWLFAYEHTPYMPEPLYFKAWSFFFLFKDAPFLIGAQAAALFALAFVTTRTSLGTIRSVADKAFFVAFLVLSARFAWMLGMTLPPDGFIVDADTHHRAVVFSPMIDFFFQGSTAASQYGGYYVWGGLFMRAAGRFLGIAPFLSADLFFVSALFVSFFAFGAALRFASGGWAQSFVGLVAALSFSGLQYRGFSYFQVEPIRWLFPCLFFLVVSFPMKPGFSDKYRIPMLFAMTPFAVHWNAETGIACLASSIFLLALRSCDIRDLMLRGLRAFFAFAVSGGALYVFLRSVTSVQTVSAVASAAGAAAASAQSAIVANSEFLIAFGLLGFAGTPMPLFHLWELLLMVAAASLAWSCRFATGNERGRFFSTIVSMSATAILLMVYYQGLSVPGTLRSMAYPCIGVVVLLSFFFLERSRGAVAKTLSAAPLIVCCLLAALFFRGGGWGPVISSGDIAKAKSDAGRMAAMCVTAESLSGGREVLSLSQNSWWMSLACGKLLNKGLPHLGMSIHGKEIDAWKTRVSNAGATLVEADSIEANKPDYARFRGYWPVFREIFDKCSADKLSSSDRAGHKMVVFTCNHGATGALGTGDAPDAPPGDK